MVTVTEAESDDAEWQHDDEHLCVQVAFGKLGEERQACHE